MDAITRIEVSMPVPHGHTWTDCHDDQFDVEMVNHCAYVYKGHYLRCSSLFGTTKAGDSSNATLYPDEVPLPPWVPLPPTGWYDIAASIRHSASAVRS